jgi:hypothetical protein
MNRYTPAAIINGDAHSIAHTAHDTSARVSPAQPGLARRDV